MEITIKPRANASANPAGLRIRMVFGAMCHPQSVLLVTTKSTLEMVKMDCHSTVKSVMVATQDIKSPWNVVAEETVIHPDALGQNNTAEQVARLMMIALVQPTMRKTLLRVQTVTAHAVTKNAMLAYLAGEQTTKRYANTRLLSDILPFKLMYISKFEKLTNFLNLEINGKHCRHAVLVLGKKRFDGHCVHQRTCQACPFGVRGGL
jgi:hypothetical protein